MFRVLLFAIVVSMTFGGDLLSFEESNAPPPLFSGYVTSTEGEVVEGAKIFITWTESSNDVERDPSIPPEDRILGSAISGADGSYEVRWNQPTLPGHEEYEPRFFLTVLHPMWVPLQRSLLLNEPGDFRATIQLSSGVPYESRVVDKEGQPVAGAKVRLECFYKDAKSTSFLSKVEGRAFCFMDLSETLTVTTNEKGEFKFPSLPRSQFVLLRVQHPEYPSESRLRTTTGVAPEAPENLAGYMQEVQDWWKDVDDDIHLGDRGRVKISVRERSTKKPIVGIEVAPYHSGVSWKTNAEGQVDLPIALPMSRNQVFVRWPEGNEWNMVFIEREEENYFIQLIENKSFIRIQGTVREAESKRGLPGVTVFYSRHNKKFTTTDKDGNYEFTVPKSLSRDETVTITGPKDGWMLPFSRKSSMENEPFLKADPTKHCRTFALKTDVSGVDFEVEAMPEATIVVYGLDDKPSPNVDVTVSAVLGWTTKHVKTDAEGEIKIPLLPDFTYLFYAQGVETGAAIAYVEKLSTENPISIKLLPSVEIKGFVWIEDLYQDVFPAEGSIVGFKLGKQQTKPLGINGKQIRMHVARVDSEGQFLFRFPKTDVSLTEWDIACSGDWFDFRDRISFDQDIVLPLKVIRPIISNRE